MSAVSKLLAKSSLLVTSSNQLNLRRHGQLYDEAASHHQDVAVIGQLVGNLYDLATAIGARNNAKAWYHLADWSFRRAQSTSTSKQVELLVDDLIPLHTPLLEKEFVSALFTGSVISGRGGSPTGSSLDGEVYDEIRSLLEEKCPSLASESIENVLDVYEKHLKKSSQLNKIAYKSYFEFLKLGDQVNRISSIFFSFFSKKNFI